MTLYAGTTLYLKIRATDGLTSKIITGANCVINLFAPPKDPVSDPADILSPDHTVLAAYDTTSRYYIATVNTTGWAAGVWWMQGVLTGGSEDYVAWDFASFTLTA